ncbi:MAG TPA: class I SAM-dependent methyltransferase [Solirubrobacteraceae bacterium]|nr:class I SAM-dependent methyltransferase [Solirubrobacteraceae bacterium]
MSGTTPDRERWNAKHREAEVGGTVGGTEPRRWLVEHRALLLEKAGGRALDVACGVGREAAYLAEIGFAVDAVDVSDVAIARVRERAGERALDVRATRMDLPDGDAAFPRPPYDVICCFYFLQRALLKPLAGALAPGGLLLYETFTRDHVEVVGGRMPERFLLDPNELRDAFAGLRVVRYREAVIGAEAPRAVASIVARA